jgi:hypothetical protein
MVEQAAERGVPYSLPPATPSSLLGLLVPLLLLNQYLPSLDGCEDATCGVPLYERDELL